MKVYIAFFPPLVIRASKAATPPGLRSPAASKVAPSTAAARPQPRSRGCSWMLGRVQGLGFRVSGLGFRV